MVTAQSWWTDAVVYQIYPRSFQDSNGDGIGDIRGIVSRLGYLEMLGVDAIWVTPWYKSPWADGGYDVQDYREIDPHFGTIEDAEELIRSARTRGIRTIIDIVPNHVSSAHPWFQAALASAPGEPARDRFWFRDGKGVGGNEPPTKWKNNFAGDTWTRTKNSDGSGGQWYLHLFDSSQPDLNWEHPDVVKEHEDILRFWFDMGAAGVRIDSAAHIMKDRDFPELEEAETGNHPNLDRDEVHTIYKGWRRIADSYAEPRALIGEVWLPDPERFVKYLGPDEMHTAFNFDLMSRAWRADEFRESIDLMIGLHEKVDAPATWVLSNHDVTRPVTRYGRADTSFDFDAKRWGVPTDLHLGLERARAAALLLAALPGSLYIYQGDELGLPEVENLPSGELRDPMYLRSGGINPGRDGCRVPLPWSGARPPFGFSPPNAQPTWLSQPKNWEYLTVDAQQSVKNSTLQLYVEALHLRRDLRRQPAPNMTWVEDYGSDVLAFDRGHLRSITNFGSTPIPIDQYRVVLNSASRATPGLLLPNTSVWLTT